MATAGHRCESRKYPGLGGGGGGGGGTATSLAEGHAAAAESASNAPGRISIRAPVESPFVVRPALIGTAFQWRTRLRGSARGGGGLGEGRALTPRTKELVALYNLKRTRGCLFRDLS